jgi:hypothetical protein
MLLLSTCCTRRPSNGTVKALRRHKRAVSGHIVDVLGDGRGHIIKKPEITALGEECPFEHRVGRDGAYMVPLPSRG